MLKSQEIASVTSCLNQSKDDEPIFVLCSRDLLAPAAVMAWAKDYEISHGGWAKLTLPQRTKVSEARDIASTMRVWKMRNT